jgi:hypothetical protein
MQLRRIVTEFPKADPTSYAFSYTDTATFDEEIDEWFSYNEAEFKRLQKARDTFDRRWRKFEGVEWLEDGENNWLQAEDFQRGSFVQGEINGLLATDLRRRCKCLQTILHVVLGVWNETAGLQPEDLPAKGKETETNAEPREGTKKKTRATGSQLEHMKTGILLIATGDGIARLFQVMQDAFKRLWYGSDLCL